MVAAAGSSCLLGMDFRIRPTKIDGFRNPSDITRGTLRGNRPLARGLLVHVFRRDAVRPDRLAVAN